MLKIQSALNASILGQEKMISEVLAGFFAHGHILLEGPPGLGKTHLAKGIARMLGFELSRIQCTPDLMPADITGSETLAAGGNGLLEFRPGPIFAPVVLVDELNRAAPRTQSAFLEAMQEGQVTYLGKGHDLPDPFWILATQNPIELEGTYPLPEAQLDRFLLKVLVPYPDADTLLRISEASLDSNPISTLDQIATPGEVKDCMQTISDVVISPAVREAAVRLITALQPGQPDSHPMANDHVRYGSSPRGLQAILRAAKVAALINGRGHVAMEDLRSMMLPSLRHRILLKFESELTGMTTDDLLLEIAEEHLQ